MLAQAVKHLYPEAKLAIGPAIDSGFYYDFDVEHPFSQEELTKIEAEMKKIVKANEKLEQFYLSPEEAVAKLANGVGVIDSGYRGEIKAKLVNLGKRPYTIFPDDRVCQLVILPYAKVDFVKVDELEDSDRGSNGYGSTGTR